MLNERIDVISHLKDVVTLDGRVDVAAQIRHWASRWRIWLGIAPLLVAFVIFFTTGNLGSYPVISGWDEGIYLQFAQNLGHYGEYASRSGDVFQRLTPSGGTGPTVVAPVAIMLMVSGGSLVAARAVMVVYLYAALVGTWLLGRAMGTHVAAACAVPLFLVAGYRSYDTLWVGRQVLAEVPALAFLLFGLWAWIRGVNSSRRWSIAASALMGLSVLTKNQFIWVVGPAGALLGLLDWLYYRQLRVWQRLSLPLGAVGGYALWFGASLAIVGPAGRAEYLAMQSALTNAIFFRVSPQRWVDAINFFLQSGQAAVAVVAVGYGLYRARMRSLAGIQRVALPLFALVALLAFLGSSVTWTRYLYPALALALVCAAPMLDEIAHVLAAYLRAIVRFAPTASVIVILLLGSVAGPRLLADAHRVAQTRDNSAAQFAAVMDATVPPDAIVVGWEWEVEFFAHHPVVHPDAGEFTAWINRAYNYGPAATATSIPSNATYAIVGPFAEQTGIIQRDTDTRGILIASVGAYRLYRLV